MSRRDFQAEQQPQISAPVTVPVDSKKVLTYEALWQCYTAATTQPRSYSQSDLPLVTLSDSCCSTHKNSLRNAFNSSLFKSPQQAPSNSVKKAPSDSAKVVKFFLGNLIEDLCNKQNRLELQHPLSSEHYDKLIKALALVRHAKQLLSFVNQLEKEFDLSAMSPLPREINFDSVSTACIPKNRIGKGEFAEVYRLDFMREDELIKSVAIKKNISSSDSVYKNEYKILETLRKYPCSRYIIQYFGKVDDQYLVFELAPFESLSEYMDQNLPNIKIELLILSKILLGLEALRLARIIHLDLKPPNIVMGYNRDPKIADFGLSKFIPANQKYLDIQDIGGTPDYLAPEVARRITISCAADIFSFAILACVLLTRKQPYEGVLDVEGLNEFLTHVITKGSRPQLPEDPQLQEINQQIKNCWNLNPCARPLPGVVSSIFQTQAEKYSEKPTKKPLQKSISFPLG